MLFFVLGLIILIVGLLIIGSTNVKKGKKAFSGLSMVAVIVGVLVMCGSLITVVPANSVGVVYSPFSGVLDDTLPEGLHVKGPFDEVYTISTETQSGSLSQITGQTKDAQFITMTVDVKYCVDTENGVKVFRHYRTLSNVANNLIPPTVQRSIEAVTTQYNIIEILGEQRNEIYKAIEEDLANRLAQSNITFISVNFVDTDAGEAIEKAIQAEAVAKKAVETAEQERLKAEIQAQTIIIEAQAQADANRIISESLTPELLAKMEMDARLVHGWITVNGGSVITDTRDN